MTFAELPWGFVMVVGGRVQVLLGDEIFARDFEIPEIANVLAAQVAVLVDPTHAEIEQYLRLI